HMTYEQRRKYNPQLMTFEILLYGDGINMLLLCSLPPPPRGSTIAQPRNTSRQTILPNSQPVPTASAVQLVQ
ncbi:hypothetical protein NPIL_421631, partial [Nephila pilipes]